MQGLAAVEATAEGDEDDGVGRPHSRPGWAGPPKRVLYSFQAPGPDPAHYHRGSCGPSRPGWEDHGDGGGEGQGGRGKEGSQSVSQRGVRIIEMKTWKRKRPASECEKCCEAGERSEGRHGLCAGGWEGQSEGEAADTGMGGEHGANRD